MPFIFEWRWIFSSIFVIILEMIYVFMYTWAFFNKQSAVFVLPKHFSFKEMIKSFLGLPFYPVLWGKWGSPPASNNNFYKIDWMGYNFECMFYLSQWYDYFQVQFHALCPVLSELYWALAISVSLCPALRSKCCFARVFSLPILNLYGNSSKPKGNFKYLFPITLESKRN